MRRLLALLLFSLLFVTLPTRAASEGRVEPEAVPSAVRAALLRGEHEKALEELVRLEAETPAAAAWWAFLRGRTLELAGRLDEAEQELARLEGPLAGSPWQAKARFHRAEVLRRLGRFEEAEAILEEAADTLRAEDRQRELARIYLDVADELSTPSSASLPADGLDYGRAFALYSRALELEVPRDVIDHAMYRQALCKARAGEHTAAASLARDYLKRFDPTRLDSPAAREGAGAKVLEARLLLGRELLAQGSRDAARRELEDVGATLEDLRARRGGWRDTVDTWSEEDLARGNALAGDAAYEAAATWSREDATEALMAVAALKRFLQEHAEHPRALQARFDIAETFATSGRLEEAEEAYVAFLAEPAESQAAPRELQLTLQQKALFSIGGLYMVQRRFDEAVASYAAYTRRFTNGPDWAEAQRGIVDAEYERAQELRASKDWRGAREALSRFVLDHPLDDRARAAYLDVGHVFAEEANTLEEDGEADARLRDAVAHWRSVVSKYPHTNEASAALFHTGQVLAGKLGELRQAIEAYRACDFGASADAARRALLEMLEPGLGLRTERTWRTTEAARVQAFTRNIEKLEVEVYALDLEAYFRKHLTHESVEDLDLDLIAPDLRFEHEVEGYERFLGVEQPIELPIEGPGVWAVVVSSEELRATTLVLRSDLDIVVKSSQREVFVYAQDMLKGTPAEGVSVLLGLPNSGDAGAPAFREAVTADDGVARFELEELRQETEVRLFAQRDGDVASNGLSLTGLGIAAELQPRAFVYTDRTAYRRGQEVSWRALVRTVERGEFSFRAGDRLGYEIRDSRARTINSGQVELSRFGTVHGSLQLDELSPVGGYSILLRHSSGREFHGSFQVRDFKLQSIELELEFDRSVYYRGEVVELTARAAYYYGEPLVDSPLRVALPDGRITDVRTDDEGLARVRFETRDMPSERALRFNATLTEENVHANGRVRLAIRGFSVTVTVDRDVVLAGDRFHAHLRALDPAGEGVARDLELTALRHTSRPSGGQGEVLVQRVEACTDDAGEASAPLQLDRGGWYTLRVEGTDRFGHRVVGTHTLFVSGDEDETRLRVLVAEPEVRVGERVTLDIHNRAGAGLALLTVESERVLEYRLVQLSEGKNPVELLASPDHYPNVHVAASLMLGDHFYRAGTELLLERELAIEVVPAREQYSPGEEAEVQLRVTDQLGRPVRAELSLAVVDEALFELFPDGLPDAAHFLDPGRRQYAEMRTHSSCGFRYVGVVEEVNEDVLAELRERASAGLDAARRAQTLEQLGALYDAPTLAGQEFSKGGDDFFLGVAATAADEEEFNDMIGLGGGAGGKFGARFGGRRNLRAAGGVAVGLDQHLLENDRAFWAPAVLTEADGTATVRFTVPDRNTRWRMTCIGADSTALVGETTASIRSRDDLFLELLTPPKLTEGDTLRVRVRVHGKQADSLALATYYEGAEEEARWQRVTASGELLQEHEFEVIGPVKAGELYVVATGAEPGGATTVETARIEVLPWGLERGDSASGVLNSETEVTLRLPAGTYSQLHLDVELDRDVNRKLARIALGEVRGPLREPRLVAVSAHRLSALLSALRMFQDAGRGRDPQAARLLRRAEDLTRHLVATQGAHGGWSLCSDGSGREAHTETSCAALVGLSRAREAGIRIDDTALRLARDYLSKCFREAGHEDDELKAMIVYALAVAGQDDFSTANRLHRQRANLSTAALAYATLALVEMDRAPMAREVAASLGASWSTQKRAPQPRRTWDQSRQVTTALALMAGLEAGVRAEWVARAQAELEAAAPWRGERARALAVEALSRVAGAWSEDAEATRVAVFVDGEELEVVDLASSPEGTALVLPLADGPARDVRVRLRREGRGKPHWRAALSGFTSEVRSTPARDFQMLETRYLAADPTYRGKTVPTGFSVLSHVTDSTHWFNEVSATPVGTLFKVELGFSYLYPAHDPKSAGDYFTMLVPLPAGTRVLDGSVQGGFETFELEPGRLIAYFPQVQSRSHLEFTLVASEVGSFRALPPRVFDTFDPSRVAIGEPTRLEVLPHGESSPDTYRPTPDELFHLGSTMFWFGDDAGARERLSTLYEEFSEVLRPAQLRETAEHLLFLGIRAGDAKATVRFFEVLKEKNPALNVPFADVLAVGRAYRELGEFERALLIFKATLDETFGKDLKVAGALEEQGEFAGSVDTLERLWFEYPDSPPVIEAYLSLSDKLLSKAPEAAEDRSLRAARRDRFSLILQGILGLQRFLAFYPTDPLAPEAGLNLVSAYLGLQSYEDVSRLGGELAEVYTKPRYRDAFAYSKAVAEWYLGHDGAAESMLGDIAVLTYSDERGVVHHSKNRDLANYIMAQIFHARREYAEAARYYELVDEQFVDAREVLQSFREKEIHLQEVTTTRVGSTTTLELQHKNLEHAELLVYAVDLMTLYLRERDLSHVTEVNLAGISPKLRRAVDLEHGRDHEVITTAIQLELEEPGAYLVLCRGDELHTSGLVLVSDLELDVREDASAGRLRVTALDSEARTFLRGVDVRVVGSQSAGFQRGETDPRGLFIADGLAGRATVIARLGSQYAFHRGAALLGVAQQAQGGSTQLGRQLDAQGYFKNVFDFNTTNRNKRTQRLDKAIQRKREGVQVQQVK